MMFIDGSRGEGGGQVLRTSLALSLVSGRAFRIENIRKSRGRPGLQRQHLACVEAARIAGAAEVEGATLGSETLLFTPKSLTGGDYQVAIGSAGSTTLVLQTVLLPLLFAQSASTVTIEGGTHNPLAPPFEFIVQTFLPRLVQMGAAIECELLRPGFMPAGGGALRVRITPLQAPLKRLEIPTRGALISMHVEALLANVPRSVAARELDIVLAAFQLVPEFGKTTQWDRQNVRCNGNALTATLKFEHTTEVLTELGARGLAAERVAHALVQQIKRVLAADVAVGEYLADQLLMPMALGAGGSFQTHALSLHATTQLDLLRDWLQIAPECTANADAIQVDIQGCRQAAC